MKFLVINGPNLNLTQFTEPGMEGQIDFNTLLDYIEAGCAQMDVFPVQPRGRPHR